MRWYVAVGLVVWAVLGFGIPAALDAFNLGHDTVTYVKNGCVIEAVRDVWGNHLSEERVCGGE